MEIRTISSFLDYFEKIRGRTLRVAQCIPADVLEWAPAPGKFTFGDVLRHLAAIERHMYAEIVSGRPSRYPGHGRDLADGQDAVNRYLDTMHREATDLFGRLSDADLERRLTTPAGGKTTAWKWLRAMVEHEVHHRGQALPDARPPGHRHPSAVRPDVRGAPRRSRWGWRRDKRADRRG